MVRLRLYVRIVGMTDRLQPGDIAPDFTLVDDAGKSVTLSDLRDQNVIVYFYSAAMTPGCTKQACDFSDSIDRLQAEGYTVLGISPDKPEKLAKFREQEGLTITLLSDPERDVLDGLGRVRREEALRQGRRRRDPVNVRRRCRRQDLVRCLQRQGHRPRRQAPQGSQAQRLSLCARGAVILKPCGSLEQWPSQRWRQQSHAGVPCGTSDSHANPPRARTRAPPQATGSRGQRTTVGTAPIT